MPPMRGEPEPPATGARVPLAAAQEAKVAILKTADAIRRRAATLLAGRGITFQQYNVLRILRGAKAGPISSAQLGQRTIEVIAELDIELRLERIAIEDATPPGHDASPFAVLRIAAIAPVRRSQLADSASRCARPFFVSL